MGRGVPEELPIIPEITFESKGLAASAGVMQVLDPTDFFRPNGRMAALHSARFLKGRP
jgi:hypothetical protein